MKKTIKLATFLFSAIMYSQVGISTSTPHASSDLELGSANKTLYLNRVANPTTDIANPQPGMILYDTTLHCLRAYQGEPPAWSACIGVDLGLGGSEGTISSFDCNAAAFSPATATQGVAYSGTLSIPYTGGNGGTYPEDDFTVNGVRFHLVEGNYNTGNGTLTYQITGTPASAGNISVDINQNGASCTSLMLPVNSSVGTVASLTCASATFNPSTATRGTAYTGTLTIPYTGGNGGTYAAQSFTNNGLTFALPAGSFATGAGNLVYNITGTPTTAGTTSVNVTAGGQSCNALALTVNNPVGTVSALTCASATFNPTSATQGTAYTGTLTIPYTGGNGGTYTAQSITQNGLTFSLPAGTFATGAGNLVYNITGTPTTASTTSINVTAGGQSCTGLSLPVNAAAPTNTVGTGSLAGRSCFDVVELFVSDECGPLASRTAQKANFALTATNTQTYTFTPSGTVSNVRFVYVNTNGQVIQSLTGGNSANGITGAVTATVVYYNNLNTTARGLSRAQALTADIYVVYNDGASNNGTDRQLKLNVKVQDCACCGAMVSSTLWKEFLCHNLGADTSLDPHTPVMGINGAYLSWGRRGPNTTGDSRVDFRTAPNDGANGFAAAPTASDPNAGAITTWISTTQPNYSWMTSGGAKTANDPCPAGFRVPTQAEWQAVINNNSLSRTGTPWTSGATNYGSAAHFGPVAGSKTLTLPAAGYRQVGGGATVNGSLARRGEWAQYFSSTQGSAIGISNQLFIQATGSATIAVDQSKAFGLPIRCISEN